MRRARPVLVARMRASVRPMRPQRRYATDASASAPDAAAAKKSAGAPAIGFRASKQDAFKGPFDTPVIGLAESGSDAVLGPLVVSAVMFDPPTLQKLSSVQFPPNRPSNQLPQRVAWSNFTKEHATKVHITETSVNELNDAVRSSVHTKKMLLAAQAGTLSDKIVTIEDVLQKKMIDTLEAMSPPEGSKIAILVPPRDLRWGTRGDERFVAMWKLRQEILAEAFPKLTFLPTTEQWDPMWMYAAYCVAKVQRDTTLTTVAEAQKQEVGTGYLHDWKTRNFLHVYVGRKKRSVHPVNIIRYHGWNRKLLDDWKTIEEKRWKLQADEYYKKYPYMVNDPLRKTGVFRKIQDELDAKKAEEEAKRRADRIKGIIV